MVRLGRSVRAFSEPLNVPGFQDKGEERREVGRGGKQLKRKKKVVKPSAEVDLSLKKTVHRKRRKEVRPGDGRVLRKQKERSG